jgi:hypothetical protein
MGPEKKRAEDGNWSAYCGANGVCDVRTVGVGGSLGGIRNLHSNEHASIQEAG